MRNRASTWNSCSCARRNRLDGDDGGATRPPKPTSGVTGTKQLKREGTLSLQATGRDLPNLEFESKIDGGADHRNERAQDGRRYITRLPNAVRSVGNVVDARAAQEGL